MTKQEEHMLLSKVLLYDDHKAFEQLLKAHQNGIKNLLLKLLDFNDGEVDDLFQETCAKIYKSIKQFKGTSSFATWSYRIAYNNFLNAHKRKKRFQMMKELLPTKKSPRTDYQNDKKMDIERMILILKPKEKVAIQLSYIQGFSHKDIATILDCPIGSVKSLIKRGKERIATNFKNYKS